MQKTIYLHGALNSLHPEPIRLEAETVAEAVRALEGILQVDEPFAAVIDGVESEVDLFHRQDLNEIHIRPQTFGGGGKGGFTQILLGVALIAVAFTLGPAGLALGSLGTISSSSIAMSGAMMVLGGVLQMLAPTPETDSQEDSDFIAASQNTVRIGTPIPLIYGTRRVGGHYLSFDVDTKKKITSDETDGVTVEAGNGVYRTHDTVYLADGLRPIRPVFSSQTAGPTNTPVAS